MIKAGIVGGTGYTGVEFPRLLSLLPQVELRTMTSRVDAETLVSQMFPSLRAQTVCRSALIFYVRLSVIDNLVKGAAGQAVHNMNIMRGLNEVTA